MKSKTGKPFAEYTRQIVVGVIIALIVTSTAPLWFTKLLNWLSPSVVGPIHVLGIGHLKGSDGKYFNFAASELDKALGRLDWDGNKIVISRKKGGPTDTVSVWRQVPVNGVGDAYGRIEPVANVDDWRVNYEFYVHK